MGYYTRYTLEFDKRDDEIGELIDDAAENTNEFSGLAYAVAADGTTRDDCKWYDHDVDMKKLSARFPDVAFELTGAGEENGDYWEKTYKEGKIVQDLVAERKLVPRKVK